MRLPVPSSPASRHTAKTVMPAPLEERHTEGEECAEQREAAWRPAKIKLFRGEVSLKYMVKKGKGDDRQLFIFIDGSDEERKDKREGAKYIFITVSHEGEKLHVIAPTKTIASHLELLATIPSLEKELSSTGALKNIGRLLSSDSMDSCMESCTVRGGFMELTEEKGRRAFRLVGESTTFGLSREDVKNIGEEMRHTYLETLRA